MWKIRRDDVVMVMVGKDRGKKGKVLRVFPREGRALIEGVHLMKKAVRPTRDNPQGGFITRERPVDLSNVRRMCPRCNRPVRVGFLVAKDGTKQRQCKRCQETL